MTTDTTSYAGTADADAPRPEAPRISDSVAGDRRYRRSRTAGLQPGLPQFSTGALREDRNRSIGQSALEYLEKSAKAGRPSRWSLTCRRTITMTRSAEHAGTRTIDGLARFWRYVATRPNGVG